MTVIHGTATNPYLVGRRAMIVEDEAEIAEILRRYLERAGMVCCHALHGSDALDRSAAFDPDVVILDINMPVMDGWAFLADLRRDTQVPVVVLTAMDGDGHKLAGLGLGADDYVVKPFNPAEVVARVAALLRRAGSRSVAAQERGLSLGRLRISDDAHSAQVLCADGAHMLVLTLTEFRLLRHLAARPNRVYSRAELLDACSTDAQALERTIDSHVSNLRRKLEALGLCGVLEGVRGVGYRYGDVR